MVGSSLVMPENEDEIRTLIDRWAEAVHAGDMDGVLADHARDIVMFDVPPPYEGVGGLDAYRDTWPGFFTWQARGARFEIVSLEITAGDDVAFAHALLRCGTRQALEAKPENRLRLTLGLRNDGGRWIVAHEHHSFPSDASDRSQPGEVHPLYGASAFASTKVRPGRGQQRSRPCSHSSRPPSFSPVIRSPCEDVRGQAVSCAGSIVRTRGSGSDSRVPSRNACCSAA